jgi:nucleotide-binding universal stress UspA family protein
MVQTVGVGTDGSSSADKAVRYAVDLAARIGARLVVISAYKPVDERRLRREQDQAPADYQWAINPTEDVDAILSDAVDLAKARGLRVTTVAGDGDPADVLCSYAESEEVDVLVIGNKGMERRVLGSVPNTISHRAPCSVLLVKTS